MADAHSPVIQRIAAARTFTQVRMVPAVLLSIVMGLLLAVAILAGGAIVFMATHRPTFAPPAAARALATDPADAAIEASDARLAAGAQQLAGTGLLPLADRLQSTSWQFIADDLIHPCRLLHTDHSALLMLMGIACLALALRWLCSWTAQILVINNTTATVQRLRQHIHRKAIRLEPADLTGEQSRVTDRLFRDSSESLERSAIAWGQCWITGLPDLIAVVSLALLVQWRVSIQVIVPVILCWFALRLEAQRNEGAFRLLAEQVERGLKKLAEGLRKARIVTGFSMEQLEQQQFEKNLAIYRQRCWKLRKQQQVGRWIHRLILLTGIIIPAYLLSRHLVGGGTLPFASAAIIATCALLVFQSLRTLQPVRTLAEEAKLRAEEINGYIARVPLVSQIVGARFLPPMTRTLMFDQVTVSVPQHPRLLNNLDLRINAGETVALISLSPLPAYSLASMIPRFVDPDSGQVLIDGQDIRQATLESLRAEVVFVGGNDPAFNTSVVDNVTCGQLDMDRHQVQEACKLVHADHFVRRLPRGYDTVVGEHGSSLDPGQVFRLSLARAIARKPALLIIEEPHTALDAETKAMLDDAYQRIASGRTLIFLPTRLSTVKKCDRIILIHEGRVAADDEHDQLVRQSELYRHWEYMRFNTFREESELIVAT